MIAVNWGTTNFRAYRLGAEGSILESRTSPRGILSVSVGGFSDALLAETDDWLSSGEKRILLSGMVGSRQGWKEAPYVPCPGGVEDLISGLVPVTFPNAEALLVPGMITSDIDGVPDVMRGEETEILGILEACHGESLVCLPGTHSKWTRVQQGKITSFVTCMTGEFFAALREHTILGRLMMPGEIVDDAFLAGIDRSQHSGGLLHHVFGARTLVLADCLRQEEAASYLSGILIGHEVRSMLDATNHTYLAGAAQMCALYAKAISRCGGTSTIVDENAAARGLAVIGRRLSWI